MNRTKLETIQDKCENMVMGSFEPLSVADAKYWVEDTKYLTHVKLVALLTRVNFTALGSIIANLWETPETDIDLECGQTAEQWREERKAEYIKIFTQ